MLGFVGCGNMAQAMLKGILSKGLYAKEDILVSRRNEEALQNIRNEFGVNVTTDNAKVAKQADVLILWGVLQKIPSQEPVLKIFCC